MYGMVICEKAAGSVLTREGLGDSKKLTKSSQEGLQRKLHRRAREGAIEGLPALEWLSFLPAQFSDESLLSSAGLALSKLAELATILLIDAALQQ